MTLSEDSIVENQYFLLESHIYYVYINFWSLNWMFSFKRFRHEGYNTCILTQVIDWPRVGIIELKLLIYVWEI